MRIIWNEDDDWKKGTYSGWEFYKVEEIKEIYCYVRNYPGQWEDNPGVVGDTPGLAIDIVTLDDLVIGGAYKISGSEPNYEELMLAAKENYKEVSEKLLVNGYCRESDFKNFEWHNAYEEERMMF